MVRKRKIETDFIIELIDDYYINICKRQNSMLKYTSIAKYMSNRLGKQVKEYEIRRCKEAVEHIKKLNSQIANKDILNVVVYDSLDVETFIVNNNSLPALKKALIERDQYYRKVSESASSIIDKVHGLENKNKALKSQITQLKSDKEYILSELQQERKKNNELSKSFKKMKNILKTNVYPEIANLLLKECGLLENGEDIISLEGREAIFSDTDSISDVTARNEKNGYSDNKVVQGLFKKV